MRIKDNIYKLIIFFLLLLIVCVYSMYQINKALFSFAETPYYTNLYTIDDTTLSINIPENWKRQNVEDILYLKCEETGEELKISYEEDGKYNVENFDTIKTLFKLEFNGEYNNIEANEIVLNKENDIYAFSFILNGKYNIVGIEKVNNKIVNFFYSISQSGEKTSNLTNILDSIKIREKIKE